MKRPSKKYLLTYGLLTAHSVHSVVLPITPTSISYMETHTEFIAVLGDPVIKAEHTAQGEDEQVDHVHLRQALCLFSLLHTLQEGIGDVLESSRSRSQTQ